MKKITFLILLVFIKYVGAQNDSLMNGNFELGDCSGWEMISGDVPFTTPTQPFTFINPFPTICDTSDQHSIVSGGFDPVTGVPKVFPDGGSFSLMLGDGTGIGNDAAKAKQIFKVDSLKSALAWSSAIILNDPGHVAEEQPYFTMRVFNQLGDTIYKNEVLVTTSMDPDFIAYSGGYYTPWITKYVNLNSYVGEDIAVEFTVGDCAQGGHYAYAYLDVDVVESSPCLFLEIEIDSTFNATCAQPGYVSMQINDGIPPYSYLWSTGDTSSYIQPTERGIYELSITDSSGCTKSKAVFINGPEYDSNFDYGVNLSNGIFRPGQLTTLYLNVYNKGCVDTAGQLNFVFATNTSLNYVSPAPDVVIGDTLIWNISGLIDSNFTPYVGVLTDTSANIGDTLCFDVFVTPTINDMEVSNNYLRYCAPVVNSYDPNYKEVFPKGECSPNYVLSNQKLTYVVHFQNTGTAPAINIHIMDTLSADLDINSIKIIGQSHQGLVTEVLNGNTLDFQFDNINLPSSSFQEIDSHGYVMFEIEPINGVMHNSLVENRVGIYFDYNDPIITNTVFNTFVDSIPHQQTILNETSATSYELNSITYDSSGTYYQNLYNVDGCDSLIILNLTITPASISENSIGQYVEIYPNPTNDVLNINTIDKSITYNVQLINAVGKTIYEGSNIKQLNIGHLSNGVYIIRLYSKDFNIIQKVFKE